MVHIALEDLTGKRFGKLTVLRLLDERTAKGDRLWECQCDCEKHSIINVTTGCLKSGSVKSCGCLRRKRVGDLTGRKFGRLTVLRNAGYKRFKSPMWTCQCSCKKKTIIDVRQDLLLYGRTRSCGCLYDEARKRLYKEHTTHGRLKGVDRKRPRLYNVWKGMRDRCNNKNSTSYKYYGARGIKVCEEWKDYAVFEKWALENGYDENAERGKCTIDRIDVDGNYEPSNCRWVDLKVQANNTRRQKHKLEQEAS